MSKIFVTREIPNEGIELLKNEGHEVVVSEKDGVLTREELLNSLKENNPDAVLCLLTDKIDSEVFDAAPSAKIFASYSVGFGHMDLEAASEREVTLTNTPGVLTDTVSEHTIAMMLSITSRIAEGDRFTRAGKYDGWGPMMLLGTDLKGKTLGILGAGRIGSRVAEIANRGLGMEIIYYDIKENDFLNSELGASFRDNPEDVLKEADVISVHVPLLDSTRHLINAERLSMMKDSAYLINSSRGPVIDENALVSALKNGVIKGAALDVYEEEPKLSEGLAELENVVLTPHIASATIETRGKMSRMAAENIISFLKGETPSNIVEKK
ncbi:D-glycerate dehydrogenase [Candidatus Kaiserbacteria bacterium]|nr:MAG: D-glycerate dehydrogenase [Candidatus Kaiserbacteria bacterium]